MKTDSKLLVDEFPLMVLPKLALAIGLNEAIALQQVHYWIRMYEQKKDEHHNHDGRWWVYNTAEEWQQNFPFWSLSTVRRTFESLRSSGLVITANYNRRGYDRTLWYTIDYDALDDVTSSQIEHPSSQDDDVGCSQNEQNVYSKKSAPIPETTSETTSETTTEKKNGEYTVADATPRTYQEWCALLKEKKNKAGTLRWMFMTLYPDKEPPAYPYINRVARKVGGAERFAHLLWENSVRPPTGDVLAYIQGANKGKTSLSDFDAALDAAMKEIDGKH